MKKSYFVLFAAVLLSACMLFTACGSRTNSNGDVITSNGDIIKGGGPTKAAQGESSQNPGASEESSQNPVNSNESSEAVETEPEHMAGMPNPMVEVDGSEDFRKELGIYINPSCFTDEYKCFIINKKLAHVTWTQKNTNGEDVEFTLRATTFADEAPMMHGIYGDHKEISNKEVKLNDAKSMMVKYEQSGEYGIYSFNDDGIYYTLTFDKPMSEAELSEVWDNVMSATAIPLHKSHVEPMLPEKFETDAIYPVSFDKKKDFKKNEDGSYTLSCDVFYEEYFDMVDLHLLHKGNTITVGGEDFVIESIDMDSPDGCLINGGFDQGGVTLVPAGGGTYRAKEDNDMMSYTEIGIKEFPVSKDIVLTDTADYNNIGTEKVIEGADKVLKHLQENDYLNPTFASTTICLEGGTVTEMNIAYRP